jgi:hypothetical protein
MAIDQWTSDGTNVMAEESRARLRKILDDESPLVVEHRFYRGSRAPTRFVCDDFEKLEQYMQTETSAGDSFWFWHFEDCCRDDNAVLNGKVPDAEGRTPKGGSY